MAQAQPVPMVDLKAQYASIKAEVDAAMARVVESAQFIKGEDCGAFEREFAAWCGAQLGIPEDLEDRLRCFESTDQAPVLRSVIPADVSHAQQLDLERHLEQHVVPVLLRRFSYSAWLALAD